MLSGSVFSKQYWTKAVAIACYTQNRSTIVKRHLKTPYEIFRGRILNINFLHVFGCPVCIHNHKYYLGKFDEKADDDRKLHHLLYLKGYPSDEYLLLYKPSQRYQVNSNVVSFIDPYERLEPVIIKTYVSYDQHDQADQNDQNDHSAHDDEILNDDQSEHSNHNNDNHIIDNLLNTEDVQTSEPLSSPAEDASVSNTIPISTIPSLSIPYHGLYSFLMTDGLRTKHLAG
ncbi:hypothetical protein Tco_0806490 [Tanacetum coccineum]